MIGRPLRYQEIPPETTKQGMVGLGFPKAFADGFLILQAEPVARVRRSLSKDDDGKVVIKSLRQ